MHAQFDQCQDFWLLVMDYPRASRSSTRGSQARGTRLIGCVTVSFILFNIIVVIYIAEETTQINL